jgi:transposase
VKCELLKNALLTSEVFVSHGNAPLSQTGRLRLACCVGDDGWPLRRAAERFQVSATTAARWAGRYRDERSAIPAAAVGPARIGYLLGVHPTTAHRVLTRYGLAKLRWLDRLSR